MLTYDALKKKNRLEREGFEEGLRLRVHRALSWLRRAEQETEDSDAAFVFLWIAFNAAYAEERGAERTGERSAYTDYFARLVRLDTQGRIYEALWQRFTGPVRMILDSKYVFQPFWAHHNRVPGNEDWDRRFQRSRAQVMRAMEERDTLTVLTAVFDRLYVLRNQLVHGGATWDGKVNRDQVKGGARIVAFLIPLFLDLMMDHPDETWGDPFYPVVR